MGHISPGLALVGHHHPLFSSRLPLCAITQQIGHSQLRHSQTMKHYPRIGAALLDVDCRVGAGGERGWGAASPSKCVNGQRGSARGKRERMTIVKAHGTGSKCLAKPLAGEGVWPSQSVAAPRRILCQGRGKGKETASPQKETHRQAHRKRP